MKWQRSLQTFVLLALIAVSGVFAPTFNPSGATLPDVGSEGDCMLTSSGVWSAGACPGAGTGAPTTAPYITQTPDATLSAEQALSALATGCMSSTTTSGIVATRVLTGTANEISVANGDCSGTPTFSLPATIDLGGKTSFEIPNGAAPTTDAFGEIAGDNNAWAASRGAVQWFDGTANTFLLGVLASDTPANGECPKWNTGGTITWETCSGSGSVATDSIFTTAGDLVQGTGSSTSARLGIGTAGQVLKVNAGATAVEWGTVSGTGDVVGPASATDNTIPRFDSTTGKLIQGSGVVIADTTNDMSGAGSYASGTTPASAGNYRFPNNATGLCARNAANSANHCLFLNASDEWELDAPLNLTGTAGPALYTAVTSPSAPAGANQYYFYEDSADGLIKYINNGGSEQTLHSTANPQTSVTGNAGTATALAANGANCSAGSYPLGVDASGAAESCTAERVAHSKSLTIKAPTTSETNMAQWEFPAAITITEVSCSTDTGTMTIQLDERARATPNTAGTNVMTSSLVCDSDSQATTSFTNAGIAADVPLNLQITATATTPGVGRIHIQYTIN